MKVQGYLFVRLQNVRVTFDCFIPVNELVCCRFTEILSSASQVSVLSLYPGFYCLASAKCAPLFLFFCGGVSFIIYLYIIFKVVGCFRFCRVCSPILRLLFLLSFLGIWDGLGFGDLGFWGFGRFILFLLISFSRFQYFHLHFGLLTHCFTELVLDIQNILSLIFRY